VRPHEQLEQEVSRVLLLLARLQEQQGPAQLPKPQWHLEPAQQVSPPERLRLGVPAPQASRRVLRLWSPTAPSSVLQVALAKTR
jgi:hypothetical protein